MSRTVTHPVTGRPVQLPTGIELTSSGSFRGLYRDANRRRQSTRSYSSVRAAVAARQAAVADVHRGEHIARRDTGVTLSAYFAEWQPRRGLAPITMEKDETRFRLHIEPFLGNVKMSALRRSVIAGWQSDLEQQGRPLATRKKAHTLLRTMLGKKGAIGDELLKSNPAILVTVDPQPRRQWKLIEEDEFERILRETPQAWRPLVVLAVFTGMRWSEIVALRRRNFDPLHGTVAVTAGRTRVRGGYVDNRPKSKHDRTIPLAPRALDALNDWLALRPGTASEDYIFRSKLGNTINHSNFRTRVWLPACERAGLPGVRFHDLRHSCASWLLAGGADLATVKEILGHASVTTTELYLHTTEERMRSAVMNAFG
jgi:integrase